MCYIRRRMSQMRQQPENNAPALPLSFRKQTKIRWVSDGEFVPLPDSRRSLTATAMWHIAMPVEEPSTASEADITIRLTRSAPFRVERTRPDRPSPRNISGLHKNRLRQWGPAGDG